MKRAVFTILAVVSLAVGVAAAGLWLRHRYESDVWTWVSTSPPPEPSGVGRSVRREWALTCAGGGVRVERSVWEITHDAERPYRPSSGDDRLRREVSTPQPYLQVLPVLPPELNPRPRAYLGPGGFGWGTFPFGMPGRRGRIDAATIPLWAIVLAAAVPPVLWEVKYRRWVLRARRLRRGLCPGCGYDLRATPGRCPECGAGAASETRA